MMNQEEKICLPYQADVRCFQNIPFRFELDGRIDQKTCSLIFPPGYSLYIEEFILENPGPDNFILLDEVTLEHRPKLKWDDRQQTFWENLKKNNPLKEKYNRRLSYPCVRALKVIIFLEKT